MRRKKRYRGDVSWNGCIPLSFTESAESESEAIELMKDGFAADASDLTPHKVDAGEVKVENVEVLDSHTHDKGVL